MSLVVLTPLLYLHWAAETGKQVYVLNMPIHQKPEQEELSAAHIKWLEETYPNVTGMRFDLTGLFESFKDTIGKINETNHSLANTRSRLRMVTLYQIAGRYGGQPEIRLKITVSDSILNMVTEELISLLSQTFIKLRYGNLESPWELTQGLLKQNQLMDYGMMVETMKIN